MPPVPDTIVFTALVYEIQQVEPHTTAMSIVQKMCSGRQWFADDCKQFWFFDDDREISEEEAFLLAWVEEKEKMDPQALYNMLAPVAERLAEKSQND